MATYSSRCSTALKSRTACANAFRLAAHQSARHRRRPEHSRRCGALQRNFGRQHDLTWPLASRKRIWPSHIGALLHLFLAAEPEDLCLSPAGHSRAGWIVCIQHCEIVWLLVLKDARLGVGVGLERAVAVEMVRRNVEHHRNPRTKGLNGLQLETRYLEDHDGVRLRWLDQGDGRSANIAADRGVESHQPR